MKRFFSIFAALVLLVSVSKTAVAAEWYEGIYIAPKISYNHVVMDKLRMDSSVDESLEPARFSKGKNDDTFGLALAIGYDFDKRGVPVRAELEYSYLGRASGSASSVVVDNEYLHQVMSYKQKMDIQTVFLNAYFDINTGTPFTPYVGAGIGFALIDVEKASATNSAYFIDDDFLYSESVAAGSKSHTNFAWNIGAGIGWDITPEITLDLGYRYMMLGEAKSKWRDASGRGDYFIRTKVDDVNIHQVQFAVRYTF